MICNLCREREASIFIEKAGQSAQKSIYLCSKCASERGVGTPFVPLNPKSVSALFKELEEQYSQSETDSKRFCSVCGRTLKEIKKTGITGCAECYYSFKAEISEILKNYGIKEKYAGSIPKQSALSRNKLNYRNDLKAKLEEAVKNENYEKAAVYRDYLHALENEELSTDFKSLAPEIKG